MTDAQNMTPPSREGRSRLSADTRREQLLDAGQFFFGQYAYADVSLSDISARAGVSRPLIQHYFGNKQKLYTAVFERAFLQMRKLLIVDTPALDFDDVCEVMRAYFEFCVSHPAGTLVAAGASVEGGSTISNIVRSFIDDVTSSIMKKLPAPARTDAMGAALSAWSYMNIGLTLQIARDGKNTTQWAAKHSTTMLFSTIEAVIASQAT